MRGAPRSVPKQNQQKRPYYGGGMPKGHRTRKTMDKEQAREMLRELVKESLRPMTEAQIANASGLKFLVLREKKSGKFIKRITDVEGEITLDPEKEIVEVWAKDPSVQAFTDLLNRTLDKPVETVQATVTLSSLDERIKSARQRVKPS